MPTYRSGELMAARRQLTAFVQSQARETARAVGFDWVGVPAAPSTYQQLRGAYFGSVASGEALAISNLYCDGTIFLTPGDNIAYRFWHDVSHVRRGLSFGLEDELELAHWHLEQAVASGLDPTGLPYRLFEADAIGQVCLLGVGRRFPIRQAPFVLDCLHRGVAAGLLAELRRVEPVA